MLKEQDKKAKVLKNKRLLDLVTDHIDDMIAVVNSDGKRIWHNQAYTRTLGYSPDEVDGKAFEVEIHPDDAKRVKKSFQKAISTGESEVLEYRLRHKNDHWLTLESHGSVVQDFDKGKDVLVFVSRDITSRKEAEEKEHALQLRLRAQNNAYLNLSHSERMQDGNWQTTIEKTIESLCATLDADSAGFWWLDEEGREFTCYAYYESGELIPNPRALKVCSEGDYVKRLSGSRSLNARRLEDYPLRAWCKALYDVKGIQSVLHVPLFRRGQLAGVMTCHDNTQKRKWFHDERGFANSLADMAMGNLEEHERTVAYKELRKSQEHLSAELAEAARYVRSLLPEPESGEIVADWIFEPSEALGGDTFSYYWVDEDHFALCLIDVCGHGIGAALHSISVLNVLRSQSLVGADPKSPGEVLEALNNMFPMEEHHNMCFTAWYGVYDCKTRVMRFASGGHHEAVVFPHGVMDDQRIDLKAKGLIMGAAEGMAYSEQEAQIPEGSSLFLYSDGCFEIPLKEGGRWTYDAFLEKLRLTSGTKLQPLVDLLAETRDLSGNTVLDDDYSLVRVTFR